ncbi:hypothetical protein BU15DRAFT_60663 [Melanogaster broomeanus]|nr:hypothetical protein BU15DRAFT_60663 [Melanogaster broomeanus]
MLDSERPFSKPIKFVRSTFTPFLFQRSEELLGPLSEEVGPDGRACCSGVSGIQRFFPADLEPEDEASNQLEEIDFADPGRIRAEIDAVAAVTQHGDPRTLPKDAMEEIYCADLAMVRAPINAAGPTAKPQAPSRKHAVEETFTGVYNIKDTTRLSSSVDVNVQKMTPSRSRRTGETGETVPQEPTEALDQSADGTFAEVPDVLVVEEESPSSSSGFVDDPWQHPLRLPFTKRLASDVILVDRTGGGEILGEEDELIVYVAPHPRSGSCSRGPTRQTPHYVITHRKVHQFPHWLFTPVERSKAALKARMKEVRIHRLRQLHKGRSAFGSFGAMLFEARLREEDERERRHPKWETRRRGDSDMDWGTDGEGDGRKRTKMRIEKNEDEDRGEHEENAEEAFDIEEELLIAESEEEVDRTIDDNDGEGTSVDPSEDDGDGKRSPGSSFQARLRKIRERGRGKVSKVARQAPDDDDSDDSLDDGFPPWTRGADDEEFTAQINNTATSSLDINASNNGNNSSATCTKAMWTGMTLDEPMDTQAVSLPVKKGKKGKGKAGYFVDELQAQ